MLETMMVVARSGEKATSEGISEFIYPTEYEPPEIPSEVDIPDKKGGLSPDDIKLLRAIERLIKIKIPALAADGSPLPDHAVPQPPRAQKRPEGGENSRKRHRPRRRRVQSKA